MDSVLIEKVDWVFYYNFEGAEWELPNRQYYDPERQVKGCKFDSTHKYVTLLSLGSFSRVNLV